MSFENVVLKYPHPCIAGIYVQDNTVYEETFLEAETPVTMIQCGAFASGRDNQLLYCTTYNEFINEFGAPNYALYGQAGYNVANALRTGNAAAYVMRVMPDDAAYAHVIITVSCKIKSYTGTDPSAPNKLMEISYGYNEVTAGANSDETIDNAIQQLLNDSLTNSATLQPDDLDGSFYDRPLMYIRQAGRGVYGNATKIGFADETDYDDDEVNHRSWRLDVFENGTSLVLKESAYGCFNDSLFDSNNGESLYLPDLVNDPEEGLSKIRFHVVDSTFRKMIDLYNDNFEDKVTASTFDPLFAKNMAGAPDDHINIVNNEYDEYHYAEGISLHAGSDGSIAEDAVGRDGVITQCLVKAYSSTVTSTGEYSGYDKHILSRYSTPADFMLDAAFANEVKLAMINLAGKRKWDAMCYIDSGIDNVTVQSLVDFLEDTSLKNPRQATNNVICELHTYKIRDTDYTGKTIPVTTTYNLASMIPNHFKTRGLGTPLVLEDARITNAVKGTFMPVIDPDEDEIKSTLYKLRGNYYETVRYGTFQRGCCITCQKATSDRLDEFNEYILQLAVKTATDLIRSKIYKFGEATDRAMYQQTANTVLQAKLGNLVRSINVSFTMSAKDERRNIVRIVLRIVYKTVIKRGIVEIYLDPRA